MASTKRPVYDVQRIAAVYAALGPWQRDPDAALMLCLRVALGVVERTPTAWDGALPASVLREALDVLLSVQTQ